MSNSKAQKQSAQPASRTRRPAFAGPLYPASPNQAIRGEHYIDQTDKLQRRNVLRYEAVFSWKPSAPLVTRAPSAMEVIELRITAV
jgi:hypothetical protein